MSRISFAISRFLRVVAGSGHGSRVPATKVTAPQDGFGFGLGSQAGFGEGEVVVERAHGRKGRLIAGLAVPILVFVGVLKLTGSQAEKVIPPPVVKAPEPTVTSQPTSSGTGGVAYRNYAIEATELEGLPPEAAPGTILEVWVTWEPPLTKGIKMQRLIRRARVEKIVPPVVPEAPATALLSVRAVDIPDLLYADRFGSLSVSVLPES